MRYMLNVKKNEKIHQGACFLSSKNRMWKSFLYLQVKYQSMSLGIYTRIKTGGI